MLVLYNASEINVMRLRSVFQAETEDVSEANVCIRTPNMTQPSRLISMTKRELDVTWT